MDAAAIFVFTILSICSGYRNEEADTRNSAGDSVVNRDKLGDFLRDRNFDQETLHTALTHDGFNIVPRKRYKRSISFAEEILKRLLSIAKPIYSSGKARRNFEMKGDWERALDDFYAFNPSNVEKRSTAKGVIVVSGHSGNRALHLRSKGGKGDPILDVIDYERKGEGRYIDRFIYLSNDN